MITPDSNCTTCKACIQICPKKCIGIDEFNKISINSTSCINCGACERVCQITRPLTYFTPSMIYAAYNKNQQELIRSSSGGIGGLLIRICLYSNFKVFSASYNDDTIPVIQEVIPSNIEKALKSKYCYADINDSYIKCRNYLKKGEKVLFIALPCQIGGLRLFLNKNYENLFCVDLFCHGAPSAAELQMHLNYKNSKKKKVVDVQFRDKSVSKWGDYCFGYRYSDGSISVGPALCDYYFSNFIKGTFFRECCYKCKYAKFERIGDVSIGDYWHITPKHLDASTNGISAVLINNEKGKVLWQLISKYCEYEEGTKKSVEYATHAVLHPMKRPDTYMSHIKKTQEEYNQMAKKYERTIKQMFRLLRFKFSK